VDFVSTPVVLATLKNLILTWFSAQSCGIRTSTHAHDLSSWSRTVEVM